MVTDYTVEILFTRLNIEFNTQTHTRTPTQTHTHAHPRTHTNKVCVKPQRCMYNVRHYLVTSVQHLNFVYDLKTICLLE